MGRRLVWRLYLLLVVASYFIGQELGYHYLGGK